MGRKINIIKSLVIFLAVLGYVSLLVWFNKRDAKNAFLLYWYINIVIFARPSFAYCRRVALVTATATVLYLVYEKIIILDDFPNLVYPMVLFMALFPVLLMKK